MCIRDSGLRICLHAGIRADERSAKCRVLAPGDLNSFVSNIGRGLRHAHASTVNLNKLFESEWTSHEIGGQQYSSFGDLPVEGCGPHLTVHAPFDPVFMGSVLSLIHISEPTRLGMISYAVF